MNVEVYKKKDTNSLKKNDIKETINKIYEHGSKNLPPTLNSDNHKTRPQEMRKTFGEIEEIEDEVGREFNRFKNFEVVTSQPSDHHYWMNMEPKFMQTETFRKRMEEEWNLLDKNIPSSIFVRAYEDRVDLMRAAFIGPPGSDYQHCLFFFDIYFPSNYPTVPPKFHHLTYGIDWNPNLRPDGRVCLDILGTLSESVCLDRLKQIWSGSSNREKWDPKESYVLHVLKAIQNLISQHSPKPSQLSLFAMSGPPEECNAKNFRTACEKMTRVLRKPPDSFEYFVAGHFRQRAHPVLLKFKENNFDDDDMIEWFNRMMMVFERNGAYCKHHLDFLKSRKEQTPKGEVAFGKSRTC